MKLKSIRINNFRSIEYLNLEFSPKCRILVGKNESGKSNILKALSFLSDEFNPVPEDVREPLPDESSLMEKNILFIFEFDDKEMEEIYSKLTTKIYSPDNELPLLQLGKAEFNLKDFCNFKKEGLYKVELNPAKKYASHWILHPDFKIIGIWKKLKPNVSDPFGGKYAIINNSLIKPEYQELFEIITPTDFNTAIGVFITQIIKSQLPKVVFWKYDDKNLLPTLINIDSFIANPLTCLPLKNMFMLAGVNDIAQEISAARKNSQTSLRNLLNRVAMHTTKHVKDIWKEYKNIKFSLEPDGAHIVASVEEKNRYPLSSRSDGFKRFATFLLMISANVKSNTINNSLIIMDEPEISLHPSGIKYLRDEILKISEKNYVVASTHSIFLIDNENIGRHYIVKKENEKTSIEVPNEDNIAEEEVLYKSLGFSLYEILNKKNIVFEGWKDKKLFETAISGIPSKYKHLKSDYKDIGICFSKGLKNINQVVSILELTNRRYLIISDNDDAAKQSQKDYKKNNPSVKWKRYNEVDADCTAITGEDFVKEEKIISSINAVMKTRPNISIEPNLKSPSGKVNAITHSLKEIASISNEERKEIVDKIKEKIFEDLKVSDIEESYFIFLEKLTSLLDN